MTPDILNWFFLITVFGVALIAPGPDFIVAIRNSVLYSRTIGIYTAIGFAAGVMVHVTYTLAGLAAIISQSILLFSLLKYAGAVYLFYIAYHALRSSGFQQPVTQDGQPARRTMSPFKALWGGFLTNALNPKATLFFLAIFSQFINPQTALTTQLIYGATCVMMTAGWFSFVALVLTVPRLKALFLRASKWIDRICGAVLIGLGLRLAFSRAT